MQTLQFVAPEGDEYHGIDFETGEPVNAWPGDVVEVSAAKADQLTRDFPDWFRRFEGSEPSPPGSPPAGVKLPVEGFADMNAKAAVAAIAEVEIANVLNAIEAYERAKGEGQPGKPGTATRVSVLRAIEARREELAQN